MATRRDYTAEAVEAARRVLVELLHVLGEYREHIVLVGGWVPDFICRDIKEPHVGSMDIYLGREPQREALDDVVVRRPDRFISRERQPALELRDGHGVHCGAARR